MIEQTHRFKLALSVAVSFGFLLVLAAGRVDAQKLSFKGAANSPVATGAQPAAVVARDFNGDGFVDIAVANGGDNSVTVLLGNGDGTFSPSHNSPFSTGGNLTTAIAVGDFNGDGILDLVATDIPGGLTGLINGITGSVGGNVSVFLGDGTGSFAGHKDTGTGGNFPTAVAVGDFDGDGKLDVAVTNLNDGTVSILLGKGDGTFNTAKNSPIQVGRYPTSVAVADFNQDGNLDVAVTNGGDGTVTILLGHGDGTFSTAPNSPVAVGARPISIAASDLNGDSKPDLVVANLLGSTVSVLLGDGTGSFPNVSTFGVGRYPCSIVIADYNNDGKPDLGVVNSISQMVSILLGDGTGSFAPFRNFAAGSRPQAAATADFNQDHQLDFAVVNLLDNTVSILLNASDITPPVTTATATPGPNANGWNNSAVSVGLSSTDPPPNATGVKEIHYTIGSNPAVVVPGSSATLNFTLQGIYSVSYFAVDNAGNIESPHSLTVQIDLTPPTIMSTQSPPANLAGWNNSNVTVNFTCNDDLSGVATCSAPVMVSTEGASQVVAGTASDNAGNTATTTRTINLDKTPPVLTMPTLAASYLLNSSLTLSFGATDALSGVASIQAKLNGTVVTSGTTVTLTQLATNTFTLTATDVAGNTSTQTATFAVVYNFMGFLSPIPNDGTGIFKQGSTIPVKFQLTDAKGAFVSTAVATLTLQMLSSQVPIGIPVTATSSGAANVGSLFRYDSTSNSYIFNLSTKPLLTGTWQIQAHLDDGTIRTVILGLS